MHPEQIILKSLHRQSQKELKKVEGATVEMKRARDVKPDDVVSADGYAFGSHSAFEYMADELKTLFEELYRKG